MVSKINTELAIATYKKSVVPYASPDASTTTGAPKENSNHIIFLWILLALIVLGGICFLIYARKKVSNTVQ